MQYKKHKQSRKLFAEISDNPQKYLIIHYSCESFYDITDGHTPRITSIAVYDYASAQTESFSMHKIAEKQHIPLDNIEEHYDELEFAMLKEFFLYAEKHSNYYWIHWNMRDMNYGFKAIEHRFSVLNGSPYIIPDTQKIDLSRQLINCYGAGYADHPRMEKLLEQNNIKAKDYLNGAEEAAAFTNREYVKLHMSTLRKVDVFANILNRAINNTLKVNSKWTEIYGLSIQGFFTCYAETWWLQVISFILGIFISEIIGNILQI